MKIYPSKHNIIQTPVINMLTDIPLAYIDTESKEYDCKIQSKISHDEIKPVLPYQEFNSYDIALFSPKKKGVIETSADFVKIDHSDIIQRVGETYQYIPSSTTTFIPQEFDYSVVVKKNIAYKTQETYNIKMGCLDDTTKTNDEILSKKLLKILGDAPQRGICPINIWVNNKDMSANSLINSKITENDFIFIQSKDGYTSKGFDYDTYEVVDIPIKFEKDFLSKHVNVWVSVDEFPTKLEDKKSSLRNPRLYTSVNTDNSAFVCSEVGETWFKVETEEHEKVKSHHIFSHNYAVAIIKEYENKGFVIYTSNKFFDNIEKNAKMFYEIIMYVYSLTYLESSKVRQWITDVPPDYVIINNKLNTMEKFISTKQIHRFFDLSMTEVMYSDIKISAENVVMNGIVNDYITFKKLYEGEKYAKYADPPKPQDSMLSIYTPQRQIMYFDDFVYEIQDNVEEFVKSKRVENNLIFSMRSFKHTYANINISEDPSNDIFIPLTITVNYQEVPITNTSFYICCKENILSYYPIEKYEERLGTIVAQIDIQKSNNETHIYDMRRRGGGLPDNMANNQELFDIGYIKGLAYRKSGAIVITLPKRLEPHKEIIENVIKKHMVAEKFPVILFEGDDLDEE